MTSIDRMRENSAEGFSLTELMIAAAVFLLVIAGVLISYIACLELAEVSKNSSLAVYAAKSKIEEMKNTPFSQILAAYNNTTFTTANLNGIGVCYVDDSNPDLLHVSVVFCWKQPNGRVLGEDKDLDGQLDVGEDMNSNGRLDSIVQIETYIYNR